MKLSLVKTKAMLCVCLCICEYLFEPYSQDSPGTCIITTFAIGHPIQVCKTVNNKIRKTDTKDQVTIFIVKESFYNWTIAKPLRP